MGEGKGGDFGGMFLIGYGLSDTFPRYHVELVPVGAVKVACLRRGELTPVTCPRDELEILVPPSDVRPAGPETADEQHDHPEQEQYAYRPMPWEDDCPSAVLYARDGQHQRSQNRNGEQQNVLVAHAAAEQQGSPYSAEKGSYRFPHINAGDRPRRSGGPAAGQGEECAGEDADRCIENDHRREHSKNGKKLIGFNPAEFARPQKQTALQHQGGWVQAQRRQIQVSQNRFPPRQHPAEGCAGRHPDQPGGEEAARGQLIPFEHHQEGPIKKCLCAEGEQPQSDGEGACTEARDPVVVRRRIHLHLH